MKNTFLTVILIFVGLTVQSQTIRYFEFRQPFDTIFTSFIVATSDPTVINDVLNDIIIPIDDRRFISGNVTNGNAGFNHNGINWYSWHFITNEWQLTVSNVEYCDGISAAIGNHPSVIAGDTIYFCPWESYPFQEIYDPGLSSENLNFDSQITMYPNPSSNKLFFEWLSSNYLSIDIYDLTGQHIFSTKLSKQKNEIDISNFREGLYFVQISDGNKNAMKKMMIAH